MSFTAPDPVRTRPELRGTFGMAASTHWLATGTAQSVLERGGTAIDAAVAAAFVLHVVEPHLNGPGGDLTAIVAAAGEAPVVIAGQGAAPAAATIEHYRAEGLDEVPGAGVLAAAVPGSVVAWLTLLADRGTWELSDVLAPAIGYARDGHPVHENVVRTIESVRTLFAEHWPSSAALWMPDGRVPEPGELVRNTALAGVLSRLLAAGESSGTREDRIHAAIQVWGSGFVAKAMAASVQTPSRHSTGGDHAGVLTVDDVGAYRPAQEAPVSLRFRGVEVTKAGPWTQGPVLLQTLAILDTLPDERLDPSTAVGVHTIAEALKLALADRDAWYADTAAGREPVPLDALLAPEYAAARSALISDRASHEFRPGSPAGREPWLPPLVEVGAPTQDGLGGTGEPTVRPDGRTPRGDTCHLDVVDRHGTIVSATPSGGWLQSSPAIPELGFCLGTRLQMTWLDPDSPSALTPGVRPRSTLSPTMLVRDGRAVEALGTPGGDQQDQWQLLYLLRRLVGGWDPQQAIDAPMFHTTSHVASFQPRTWTPGGLVVESRLGEAVIAELRDRGHRVTVSGPWTLGRLSAVGIDRERGWFYAAANSRGAQGYAAGR